MSWKCTFTITDWPKSILFQPCGMMVVRSLGVPQIAPHPPPPNELKARSHLPHFYCVARPPKTKAGINLVIAVSVGARMLFPYSIYGANPGSPSSSLSSIWISAVGTTHPRRAGPGPDPESLNHYAQYVTMCFTSGLPRASSSSEFRFWPADFRLHKIWGAKLGQANKSSKSHIRVRIFLPEVPITFSPVTSTILLFQQ